ERRSCYLCLRSGQARDSWPRQPPWAPAGSLDDDRSLGDIGRALACEIAGPLALEDDVACARIGRGFTLQSGFEREVAALERELAGGGMGGGQRESPGLGKEAGFAVGDFEHNPFARIPLDLERPVGPSRRKLVLADHSEPLTIWARIPKR